MHVLTPEGQRSAAINFDESRVSRALIAGLAAEARPELENARLRAAISMRLVEVQESRNRIVAAQLEAGVSSETSTTVPSSACSHWR